MQRLVTTIGVAALSAGSAQAHVAGHIPLLQHAAEHAWPLLVLVPLVMLHLVRRWN